MSRPRPARPEDKGDNAICRRNRMQEVILAAIEREIQLLRLLDLEKRRTERG
jgi:hypothetical protein